MRDKLNCLVRIVIASLIRMSHENEIEAIPNKHKNSPTSCEVGLFSSMREPGSHYAKA